jgi:hypothetical protein
MENAQQGCELVSAAHQAQRFSHNCQKTKPKERRQTTLAAPLSAT